jgi:putative membrane protein
MSIRVYSGPHSDRGGPPTGWLPWVPWVLAGLTILGQIAWVLVQGQTRTALTLITVGTFFAASVTHAMLSRGSVWTAGYVAISLGIGWGVEVLGTTTRFPFGDYTYSPELGPALLGVPIVIPLAWAMMAYPCLLAAQRLATTGIWTALIGGWLIFSWDLFLDPQMVSQGYWTWNQIGWTLPGIPGIPLQNFLGWLLTGIVLMAVLDRLPRKVAKDTVPNTMLTWVFASSVLANAAFFGRPAVAVWGGLCSAIVLIPWWWRLWSQPQW